MYKIGLKHKGVIIATSNLSVEEVKKLEVNTLSFISRRKNNLVWNEPRRKERQKN
jgi:hypothetical protein